MAKLLASDLFKKNAEQAVAFEKLGQYETALAWWEQARTCVTGTSYENIQYAERRAAYCKRWANA